MNCQDAVRQRFWARGLEAVLHDQRQERRRQALSGEQIAHLVALACSPVPDGHDHWTLRLLANPTARRLGNCAGCWSGAADSRSI